MTPRLLVRAANVRDLFHKGNLNVQDERGYTCLHWLVVTGNDRPLRRVLQDGADPTIRDAQCLTAMDRACQLGRFGMVQTMVAHCGPGLLHSNTTTTTRRDGRTPLHFANESMQASNMVTLLLELGADVNVASSTGRTILHESILRGSCTAEHLNILLAYGANIEARDEHGWTPLHYAAYLGHVNVVQQLLYYGANPVATDRQGRTPMHVTAGKVDLAQWDQDVTMSMMNDDNHSCHSNNNNKYASPALQETMEWSRKFGRRTSADIVHLLLAHGADTWVTDDQSNLTFSLAASAGEVDVTYEILQVAAMEGLFG